MANAAYDGPIIDAHHHFWDLGLNRHPWLANPAEHAFLRRDHLVADYLKLAAGSGIVATVHAEANWDPSDPLGETEWLDRLDRPAGIASRYVAYAELGAPDAAETLERLAGHGRVVGIREILSWHPDAAKARAARRDIMRDAVWRGHLALFERHHFSFDLLISPWQLDLALELAQAFPGIRLILNHCGSPMDRDAEGMARWRQGMKALGRMDNVFVKLSDPVAYDPRWTRESLAEVLLCCIDCFGPARSMFATDHPVSGLHIGFGEWLAEFGAIVAPFSDDEKRALYFGCARDVYRVPLP